jgi:hypothetical protein
MVKRPRTEGKSEEDARFFVNIHCNLKVFLFSISRPTIMSDVVYGEFFRIGHCVGLTASVGSRLTVAR